MYTLKDEGVITEIKCDNNFEYIIKEESFFSNTEYKVLLSQNSGIFIPCMKMMKNGKIDLYYITNSYRSLAEMYNGMSDDSFLKIVVNIFASIIDVRNNGFLSCEKIDMSWDKIFVDQNTLKIKFIYLPLNVKLFSGYAEFENEFRSSIIKLIDKMFDERNERLEKLVQDLSSGELSIDDVYNRSRSVTSLFVDKEEKNSGYMRNSSINGNIKLVLIDKNNQFEMVIDRANVTIGKKQELVDKTVLFNNKISRRHCRIIMENGMYYIADEGSANGTFVNGEKVAQGQYFQINRGDIIRLADSEFEVI